MYDRQSEINSVLEVNKSLKMQKKKLKGKWGHQKKDMLNTK